MRTITRYCTEISLIAAIHLYAVCCVYGQTAASIPKQVVSSGAVVQTGNCTLYGTIGQPAVGVAAGTSGEGRFGFWYLFGMKSTGIDRNHVALPVEIRLQVYPNPIQTNASIEYTLDETAEVRLVIHDFAGRSVRSFNEGQHQAGVASAKWDGCNGEGVRLPAGLYLVSAHAYMLRSRRSVVTTTLACIANK